MLGSISRISVRFVWILVFLCMVGTGSSYAQFEISSPMGSFDPKDDGWAILGNLLLGSDFNELNRASAGVAAAISNSVANAAISSSGKLVIDEEGFPVPQDNQGSLYLEPPWTLDEGNSSIGLGYSYLNFKSFNGKDLNELFDFTGFINDTFFDIDTDFDLEAHIWALSYGYGVTDKFDVNFVFPLIALSGKGVWKDGTTGDDLYVFGEIPTRYDRTDTGLGDIMMRMKYELMNDGKSALSIGGDLIFPTGDEDKYLGGGDMGYRIRALYGRKCGKFFPSMEIGYLWTPFDANIGPDLGLNINEELSYIIPRYIDKDDYNQFEYKFALPYEINSKVTASVEWIGSIGDAFKQNDIAVSTRMDLADVKDGLIVDLGLRIPVDDDGLRTDITPTVALEYRF